MKLSLLYKQNADENIEVIKSWSLVQGDRMRQNVNFDPGCTSAPMVERYVTWMMVTNIVKNDWTLEQFDIHSASIHEKYKYHKPV